MSITQVIGKPGRGKSAFLTAVASLYLSGPLSDELFDRCVEKVEYYRANGLQYTLPERAPVFGNYKVIVPNGYNSFAENYYVDGFHLGFENGDVPVFYVYPYSKIFLDEAQRYYNSRKSMDFPDWISRYYEEARHFGLDFWIASQRGGLIDISIREIADLFVEPYEITQQTDKFGFVSSTTFHLRVFDDWKYVEKYLASTDGKGTYVEQDFTIPGNVFDYYVSETYEKNFLPREDFNVVDHLSLDDVKDDVELSKMMYRQTPPEGFYKKRGAR